MNTLGSRMKEYEHVTRTKLPRRMPVLIRIDGKAFHTYTKGIKKPFDETLMAAFWETCQYLAKKISGCKVVYHQSDEISLLLTNDDTLETEPWYDNNILKLVSVSASLATAKFNEVIHKTYPDKELAIFDARAFVLPKEEVNNYFVWRQQDAMRNSVSAVGQAHFKHKELQGLRGDAIKRKLMEEKAVIWDDMPIAHQRGVCIIRDTYLKDEAVRHHWKVEDDIPVFAKEPMYIQKFLLPHA